MKFHLRNYGRHFISAGPGSRSEYLADLFFGISRHATRRDSGTRTAAARVSSSPSQLNYSFRRTFLRNDSELSVHEEDCEKPLSQNVRALYTACNSKELRQTSVVDEFQCSKLEDSRGSVFDRWNISRIFPVCFLLFKCQSGTDNGTHPKMNNLHRIPARS